MHDFLNIGETLVKHYDKVLKLIMMQDSSLTSKDQVILKFTKSEEPDEADEDNIEYFLQLCKEK